MVLPAERIDAVIFDLDGVVTDTARVHERCWKRVFDDFLRADAERTGMPFEPFSEEDYLRFVDGKPRYDGAASFLESRGFKLEYGSPADPPGHRTICAIANLKDREFERELHHGGVKRFESTVTLIHALRSKGIRTAIISSSRNADAVLDAAGVQGLFDAEVNGLDAPELGLPGKPDPAIFLTAAERLHVSPGRASVVEDALAGVEAGRRGRFGQVIGVDRIGQADALLAHGADAVVADLADVEVSTTTESGP